MTALLFAPEARDALLTRYRKSVNSNWEVEDYSLFEFGFEREPRK